MLYTTMHIQKDKRIVLGTCVHLFKDCSSLKSRTGITIIAGPILEQIPKCSLCFKRNKKK